MSNQPVFSPWGSVQTCDLVAHDVFSVSTPSHGGFMIGIETAKKVLSNPALGMGEVYGDWICYEEDVRSAILTFEIPELRGEIMTDGYLIEYLSGWHPEYLIERFIAPDSNHYQRYLDRKADQAMRLKRNPDLIISALMNGAAYFGDGRIIKGATIVVTADDRTHTVTSESYRMARTTSSLNLLSKCEVIG